MTEIDEFDKQIKWKWRVSKFLTQLSYIIHLSISMASSASDFVWVPFALISAIFERRNQI